VVVVELREDVVLADRPYWRLREARGDAVAEDVMRVLGPEQRVGRRRGVLIVQIRHAAEAVKAFEPHLPRVGVERLYHATARRGGPQRERRPPRDADVPERGHGRLALVAGHLLQA